MNALTASVFKLERALVQSVHLMEMHGIYVDWEDLATTEGWEEYIEWRKGFDALPRWAQVQQGDPMTISELAKIALDEKRDVKVRRKAWDGIIYGPLTLWHKGMLTPRFIDCASLLADDWYEVKPE